MVSSEKAEQPGDAYNLEAKTLQEQTWRSSSSSGSSLKSVEENVHHKTKDDHGLALADLEPSASINIPVRPLSYSGGRSPAFEVKWGENDAENPKNWPFWKKAHTIFACTLASCTVIMYSSAYTSGIKGPHGMTVELKLPSEEISLLGLTTYLFGMAAGSLIWAPLSEMLGRRPVYISTTFAFMFFVLPCALAKNGATVLVCRFFAAMIGCSVVSNSPGTINDISTEHHRALTLGIWCIGLMNGPVIGPLIGGFVFENLGWRWIHWIILILAGVSFLSIATVPETFTPTLLRRRAEKMRKESGSHEWWTQHDERQDFWPLLRTSLWRPIYLLISEPILWFWDFYILIIYAMSYMTFVIYPRSFGGLRGWSSGMTGLSYLGIGLGNCLVIGFEPLLRKVVQRRKLDAEGRPTPESPVFIVCIGAILTPIGGLVFAWTCTPNVHWIVPILSGVPFGAGTTAAFIYGSNYVGRTYGMYAASALAGNVVTRTIAGGVLPLAGPAMWNSLGPHWQGTLVGLLEVVIVPIPFVFYKYGHLIRQRSKFVRQQQEAAKSGEKSGV